MDKPLTASSTLDPVTFEVLRNAFVNIVDQMAEQVRRTCYSFVVYNRDFSNALCDAEGNTVAQGNQDLAAHVGTLHYTCKAVLEEFGDDIHPGDVFLINDPYVGGTHFSDTRVLLPIFCDGKLIAWSQANGHWADMGGSVPGSFDVTARDMFKEGHPCSADQDLAQAASTAYDVCAPRREEYARSRGDHRRHGRANAGDAHRGAGITAAVRQVRRGHDHDRVRGSTGLRRACRAGCGSGGAAGR